MLRDILSRVKKSATNIVQDYSSATWDPTKLVRTALSNGNKTHTPSQLNQSGYAKSNVAITGSIYVEITIKGGGSWAGSVVFAGVGLQSTDAASNLYGFNTTTDVAGTYIYGVSFNHSTLQYEVRRNNTVVASGTAPAGTYVVASGTSRIYATSTLGEATLNAGATAFTYTPVYI